MNLWAMMFEEEPYDLVAAAAAALIKSRRSDFPPSIGELSAEIQRISAPEEMTELEVWHLVTKATENAAYESKDVTAILETFAERITKIDYERMELAHSYATWRGKETPEKPEDADSVKYYFKVDETPHYSDIALYREKAVPTSEEMAAEEETKRRRRELDLREEAMKDATNRAHQLRRDFIRDYSGAKKHLTEILIFAGKLLAEGTWGRTVDENELAGLLGITPEGKDGSIPPDAYSAKITERPEHTFLATVYSMKENVRDGYYQRRWNSEKREYHIGRYANPNLDELYEFLQELGYEMSDEELALQNRTHELFQEGEK